MAIDHICRKHGKTFALALMALFGVGIALLWGWNTFAVEILSQQEMRFKHALALEFLVLCAAGMILIARRIFGKPTQ